LDRAMRSERDRLTADLQNSGSADGGLARRRAAAVTPELRSPPASAVAAA
jgi:hypothetical protein